jgi:ribonuclease HII
MRGVNDSKLLAPARRTELAGFILREAAGVGLGMATNAEIDDLNVFRASQLAMKRALRNLLPAPQIVLVDGLPLKEVEYEQLGIPQGDRKSVSVAAASIIAKVFRDDLMNTFDAIYAGYGLARHKGYGTAEHLRRLRDRGPTRLHRMSFKLG